MAAALDYKADWDEAKQRCQAWWAGEAMDRCALSVTAPRADAPAGPDLPWPSNPLDRWTDLDFLATLNDAAMRGTFFGGEALPIWTVGYAGHTAIPAFLGCPTELDFETGWWHPIQTGEALDLSRLRLDRTSRWWQFTIESLRRAVRESAGKSIPSIGAFGGGGDMLAALRGTDRLLYDIADRPDQVRAAEAFLMDLWCEVYDEFHAILRDAAEGSVCWMGVWSPGKTYAAQNDFSYMISPRQFADLFLPAIERQSRFLDHTIYHVDGLGAFAHVPALCDLPRIQALQIVPGAGKPSPLHFMDLLKDIQRRGKNLHISLEAREVEPALAELSARGLYICTSCRTEAEARALIENAKRWSRDRRA
jgi:hypothetical protein